MNKQNIPTHCPSCGNTMQIESLRCPVCSTAVSGQYPLSRYMRLRPEQLLFLETFLYCRGNLKDVGALLDISYPTARTRLDELLAALDFDGHEARPALHRMEILDRMSRGEITHEEAIRMLKGGNSDE